MRKPGHHLGELKADLPPGALRELRQRFSITTAEELIAAHARSGESLRQALPVEAGQWRKVIEAAHAAVPPVERRRLAQPSPRRAAGAKLGGISPDRMRAHASGITVE